MVSVLLRWTEGKCHAFPGSRDDDIARKHFTARTKPHSSRQISPTRHLLLCRLECGETQNPNRQWWTWRGSNPRPHDCQQPARFPFLSFILMFSIALHQFGALLS